MGRKNLYKVIGSIGHTTFDEEGSVYGGGCSGEKTEYILANNIKDVIEKVETMHSKKYGNTEEFINITSVVEVDYITI